MTPVPQQRHFQGKSTCTRARSPSFFGSESGQTRFPVSARPAFIIFVNSDADSAATLVHAFATSRVDYCNAILAAAPKTITDRLQRVLNAVARVVSDTKKFDQGQSRLMYQELHWLDFPEQVNYKLGVSAPQLQGDSVK